MISNSSSSTSYIIVTHIALYSLLSSCREVSGCDDDGSGNAVDPLHMSVKKKDGNPVTCFGQFRSTVFNDFETLLHAHLVTSRV